jgi:hypothetical protein
VRKAGQPLKARHSSRRMSVWSMASG